MVLIFVGTQKIFFATLINLIQSLAWSGLASLTKVTNRNDSATSQGNDWSIGLGSDEKVESNIPPFFH